RAGIASLLSRMGRHATVLLPDGSTRRVSAEELEPGMTMLVAAGDALAADGTIEAGTSAIDNAMLTGESTPEDVSIGQSVHAGAVNLLAPIRVRITAAAQDTAIAEIARLMDEAGQSRSRYVRIADRASRLYAPVVHTLALLAFVGWMIAGAGWHQSLVIAIAVLIITCPCAMGLAVPAAQVVASGALLKKGLLVKDGSALERLAEADIAVFDKTGTLTLGEPVAELAHVDEHARPVALALALSSHHPLSRALTRALTAQGVKPAAISQPEEIAGEGVFAMFDGQRVSLTRPLGDGGATATELRIARQCWTIPFHDALRPDAADAIARIAAAGLDSRIISGDADTVVSGVAADLGISGHGRVSPQAKLAELERLKAEGKRPLMVGDGLNDGPALAAAHVSIAPGTASDVSQQAADAVFVGERLMPVALAVVAAQRTMRVVRQNFGFAILYNMLAIPLALFGFVTPLIAALAMSFSSLVVVANSLRLTRAAR
ncbi:cadmium-translocating P-type ATPase, partial [Alteriqipengyuania sp. NZ-12B]